MKGVILVVEDNDKIRNYIEILLKQDYSAIYYSSGLKAEESIRSGLKYNLALIDLCTNIDGNKLADTSKKFNPKVPVILMSVYFINQINCAYSIKNWDDYFEKSLAKKDFLEKINSFLKNY